MHEPGDERRPADALTATRCRGADSVLLRAVHPRIGQFAKFAVGLARHDNIAPTLGTTTVVFYLDQYFVGSSAEPSHSQM